MSYDQKPSRIKLVSSGGPARAPENALVDTKPIEQAIEDAQQAGAATAKRFPLVSVIVFLSGSAIGGAGLVAWPHLVG